MIEFGKTLRDAREAKGYTIAQIAEMTNVMPSILERLENEDFSKIVAPIYGRGFVKLYCESVGIDPKPMIAEFMEIFNGNREPTIRERAPHNPAPPDKGDSGNRESLQQPPVDAQEPEETPPAAPVIQETPPEPAAAHLEPPPADDLFSAPFVPQNEAEASPSIEPQRKSLSRFAPPTFQDQQSDSFAGKFSLPENFWRMALLAACGVILIGLIVFGVITLYRATSESAPLATNSSKAIPDAPATPQPGDNAPAARPARPTETPSNRNPQKIPPLYVD